MIGKQARGVKYNTCLKLPRVQYVDLFTGQPKVQVSKIIFHESIVNYSSQ